MKTSINTFVYREILCLSITKNRQLHRSDSVMLVFCVNTVFQWTWTREWNHKLFSLPRFLWVDNFERGRYVYCLIITHIVRMPTHIRWKCSILSFVYDLHLHNVLCKVPMFWLIFLCVWCFSSCRICNCILVFSKMLTKWLIYRKNVISKRKISQFHVTISL